MRVQFPDEDETQSYWIDVVGSGSSQNASYEMPDGDDDVWCALDPAGEGGCVLGTRYNQIDRPKTADPNVTCNDISDGSFDEHDPATGTRRIKVSGRLVLFDLAAPDDPGLFLAAALQDTEATAERAPSAAVHPPILIDRQAVKLLPAAAEMNNETTGRYFATKDVDGKFTGFYNEAVHGRKMHAVYRTVTPRDVRQMPYLEFVGYEPNPDCLIPNEATEISEEEWRAAVS